jgi:hypothetical protein
VPAVSTLDSWVASARMRPYDPWTQLATCTGCLYSVANGCLGKSVPQPW